MTLKHEIRRLVRKIGIDIRSVQPFDEEYQTLVTMLDVIRSNLILDVGANDGGFAKAMFRAHYPGRIVSYEPLPDAHQSLQLQAKRNARWEIGPQLAISNRTGSATFHIAGNSSSSSLLDMMELHTKASPQSKFISDITVELERLDAIAKGAIGDEQRIFLKIDTQGTEADVIDGASGIMDRVIGIRVELSLDRLYQGQLMFPEMYARITAMGFDAWEITPVLRDMKTGRMLQCDATFVRHGALL